MKRQQNTRRSTTEPPFALLYEADALDAKGQHAAAAEKYWEAAHALPDRANWMFYAGRCFLRAQDTKSAIRALSASNELSPHHPVTLMYLARAHRLSNHPLLALRALEGVTVEGSNHTGVILERLAALERLRRWKAIINYWNSLSAKPQSPVVARILDAAREAIAKSGGNAR